MKILSKEFVFKGFISHCFRNCPSFKASDFLFKYEPKFIDLWFEKTIIENQEHYINFIINCINLNNFSISENEYNIRFDSPVIIIAENLNNPNYLMTLLDDNNEIIK